MRATISVEVPQSYSVRDVIQAAIVELNEKTLHYRLLNKPDLYELFLNDPEVSTE